MNDATRDHIAEFNEWNAARQTSHLADDHASSGGDVDDSSLVAIHTEHHPEIEYATRDAWVRWFNEFGAAAFFDSFLSNCQGAESRCQFCRETITLDIVEGGGVPDWGNDGDYGCMTAPETCWYSHAGECVRPLDSRHPVHTDGSGGHLPEGVTRT